MTATRSATGRSITRRKMLLLSGASGVGLALQGCGGDSASGSSSVPTTGASDAVGPGCVLTPEAIEGPFYADVDLMRRDITGGREGQKLILQLKVVDANDCSPLSDASVDLWHADATGLYSAFTEQGDNADVDTTGETFLRGVQSSDGEGVATFDTIYPGWYPGRTTHVHVKVHFADKTRVTTQLYFPDDITSAVYGEPAYRERGDKDTPNASDEFGGDNQNLLMSVTKEGDTFLASGTLGIDRT